MKTIVSVKNATKDYTLGNIVVPALRGVTLDVHEGEFLSIAGPSGSGKTTLLNLIGCVDTPTSGTVEVAGKDTGKLSERQLTRLRLHTIGFIFQSFNLVSVLSVFQNVELPLLLQRHRRPASARSGCWRCWSGSACANTPSTGPASCRAGSASAWPSRARWSRRPQLVLADEPTANLDSVTGQNIIDLMKELNRTEGTTFIFSTHDARVMAHASAVVRLADGKFVDRVIAPPRR